MKVLWISTKAPWPTVDGGRLLQALTIEGLVQRGCRVQVVCPAVGPRTAPPEGVALELAGRPAGLAAVLVRRLRGEAATMARHRVAAVARAAARGAAHAEVVHVEQLQAWPQAPVTAATVLRAQNVEHALWLERARLSRSPLVRWWYRREARALARAEREGVAGSTIATALTAQDATRLEELSGRAVEVVAAPFPSLLEPGPRLAGDPALALLVGRGWGPNLDGARWFVNAVWPEIRRARPQALLHCFGGQVEAEGVVGHEPPHDPAVAFPSNGIVVVPLRVASGVRMKILEAWARGVVVVATPIAGAGLDPAGWWPAHAPAEWVEAVQRLSRDRVEASRRIAAGRDALALRHAPTIVADQLIEVYRRASGSAAQE